MPTNKLGMVGCTYYSSYAEGIDRKITVQAGPRQKAQDPI
jgi:hypothetical protein